MTEKKFNPKFKIGDKVWFKNGTCELPITGIVEDSGSYLYNFENVTTVPESLIEYLIKTSLKEYDPVLVSDDGKKWWHRSYKGNNECYVNFTNEQNDFSHYKYIVPHHLFDFKDLESNINRSVV